MSSFAFYRVWHEGLAKLKGYLPSNFYIILKSYLTNRYFQISQSSSMSQICPIKARVPQGNMLGPLLYTRYTADIPLHPSTVLSTFVDDTYILSPHPDPNQASEPFKVTVMSYEFGSGNGGLRLMKTRVFTSLSL